MVFWAGKQRVDVNYIRKDYDQYGGLVALP